MELNFTGKGSAFYPPFKNTGAYMLSGKRFILLTAERPCLMCFITNWTWLPLKMFMLS